MNKITLTKEQEKLIIESLIESGEIELRSVQKTQGSKGRKIGTFFTALTVSGRRYVSFKFAQYFRDEMRDILK
jgi:hypothetical protein